MERRHVLQGLPVVGTLTLAGCSSLPSFSGSGTILGKIEVINSSFVSNRIRVIVERGSEVLVENNISLAGLDAEDSENWTIVDPSWSQTEAQYTVRSAHIDDSGNPETDYWEYSFSQEDYNLYYEDKQEDPGCIGVGIRIGSLSDEANAPISVHPSYMKSPCEVSDST